MTMRLLRTGTSKLALLLAMASLLLTPLTLFAHAILMEVSPKPQSTVTGREFEIKLRFNVRVDAKRSRVVLILPDNSQKLLSVDQPAADILETRVDNASPGKYSVRWQVLASDGHITQGAIPFTVKS